MTDEIFAVPVKYMVIKDSLDLYNQKTYMIIDTSYEGQGKIVVQGLYKLEWAHHVCKLINNAEGFQYEP